jgi:hypothetical protein
LSHSISSFFVKEFFKIGSLVSRIICLGWLWTSILLISASWVARITGVSHWCPVHIEFKASLGYIVRPCLKKHKDKLSMYFYKCLEILFIAGHWFKS